MGLELYPASDRCPCGSRREAQYCCLPLDPPVSEDPDIWKDVNFEVSGLGIDRRTGEPVEIPETALPPALRPSKISLALRQPSQIDPEVEELFKDVREDMEPPDGVDEARVWRRQANSLLENLISQVYGARYHQRQFFARLRKVMGRQALGSKGTRAQLEARFLDRPLKSELEAYLIRVLAVRDPLGQFGLIMLGFKPADRHPFREFQNKIYSSETVGDPLVQTSLESALDQATWIGEARDLRNQIVHEGAFQEFQAIGQTGRKMLDAKIGDQHAGRFCLKAWRGMRDLTSEVLTQTVPLSEK